MTTTFTYVDITATTTKCKRSVVGMTASHKRVLEKKERGNISFSWFYVICLYIRLQIYTKKIGRTNEGRTNEVRITEEEKYVRAPKYFNSEKGDSEPAVL